MCYKARLVFCTLSVVIGYCNTTFRKRGLFMSSAGLGEREKDRNLVILICHCGPATETSYFLCVHKMRILLPIFHTTKKGQNFQCLVLK